MQKMTIFELKNANFGLDNKLMASRCKLGFDNFFFCILVQKILACQ